MNARRVKIEGPRTVVSSCDNPVYTARMHTPQSDLESKLARFIGSYIHASASGSPSDVADSLRWVCSGLEFLLGSLLDECEGWNGWVDGIHPATDFFADAVKASSEVDLTVRAQALWYEHGRQGGSWIEPFLGVVRISKTHDAIDSYEISFGDAGLGLGKFPFGRRVRRADWYYPAEWLFLFSKKPSDEKSTAVYSTQVKHS